MGDVGRYVLRWLVLVPVLLFAAGCGDDGGARFVSGGGVDIPCMQHQPEPPGSRYTDPEQKKIVEVLEVLRYYTENGRKPYCDGQGPTEIDQQWARYYVSQGADPTNVAPILGNG